MTGFKPYEELVPQLELTCRSKVYRLPYVAAEDAPVIRAALDPEVEQPAEGEVERILLGDTADAMRADRVPPGFIQRALLTAISDFSSGRRFAEAIWETAGEPGVLEAWLEQRATEGANV